MLHETLAALADPAERARRLELAQANVARWREQPEVVQPFVHNPVHFIIGFLFKMYRGA